jgi:multicomponent K+:H+ antiporter subunit E
MKRLIPYPLRSLLLLVSWLILNQTLHPAHWVLGALLGIALPLALAALTPRVTTLRRAGLALALLGVFLKDIVVHAFNVDDEAALVRDIQQRYERPLQEIFT